MPDTLDGRFAVLATLIALTLVRLESGGEAADRLSVALTERFIEVMESEHRELGLGDPALGKTVRKLVRMLGKRTELWRKASSGRSDWTETTRASLYKGEVGADALRHSAAALWRFDKRLVDSPLAGIEQGEIA